MTPLPHENLLSTLAEMSIAVVGFSMVVGILRTTTRDDRMRLFTLRDVADIGLIGAIMSAFPIVAYAFEPSVDSVWRSSTALLAVWQVVSIGNSIRKRGSVSLASREYWLNAVVAGCLGFTSFGLIGMNLVSPGPLSGARYIACMLILLAQAGFMFILAAFDVGRGKVAP